MRRRTPVVLAHGGAARRSTARAGSPTRTRWRSDVGRRHAAVANARPDPALVGDAQTVEVIVPHGERPGAAVAPGALPPVSTNVLADGLRWDPEVVRCCLSEPDRLGHRVHRRRTAGPPPPRTPCAQEEFPRSPRDRALHRSSPPTSRRRSRTLAQAWTADARHRPTTRSSRSRSTSTATAASSPTTHDVPAARRLRRAARLPHEHQAGASASSSRASMAVMLRIDRHPGAGRRGVHRRDLRRRSDSLRVTTENAHAWVEVLFPGYGWLTFEPTPGRQNRRGLPVHSTPQHRVSGTTGSPAAERPGRPGPADRAGRRRGAVGPTRRREGRPTAAAVRPRLAGRGPSIRRSPCPSPIAGITVAAGGSRGAAAGADRARADPSGPGARRRRAGSAGRPASPGA